MGITNKAISTKLLNIIIRTNHGQIEIVMQYGGLRSSVTCVTTSCSNDSFTFPTHRTNQSVDKGLWDVVRHTSPVVFTSHLTPCIVMLKNVIRVSLLQKGQNDRIKNIDSVFYSIQCSLNNFERSATMTNSSPDNNTSASKTIGLVHTLVRKMFHTPAVHTITSIAKTK